MDISPTALTPHLAADPDFTGKVSREWLSRGVWLSDAWQLVPNEELERVRRSEVRFAELRDGETPAEFLMANNIEEYADPSVQNLLSGDDLPAWREYRRSREAAKRRLISYLWGFSGIVRAFGKPQNIAGDFEWIDPPNWPLLKKDTRAPNVVSGGGLTYWNVHVVDAGRWPAETPPQAADPVRDAGVAEVVRQYVSTTQQNGRLPTQRGLEAAWRETGGVGHRDELFAYFKEIMGHTAPGRGRPRKKT